MEKKKYIIKISIVFILSIISIILISHDDFLYQETIMKIDRITTKETKVLQNSIGLKEKYTEKIITGTITNGEKKDTIITTTYEESFSSIVTEKYKVGDKVFIKNNTIEGLKRDTYIAILIAIFINLIYIVGNIKGLLSVATVIGNTIIFYLGLDLYFRGINILFLCIIESILCATLSLFIAGGINKKTISAITSVTVSTIILLTLTLIIAHTTNYSGVNFNELSFLTVPPEDILIPELLIGSIGAMMDVAITISAAMAELLEKNKKISAKKLTKSAKEIGKDIMSTMTSVLFFTYLSAGLPVFILAIRNGFSIHNYITSNFSLELTRFLVGSIGIIMTIPISSHITVSMMKRGGKHE